MSVLALLLVLLPAQAAAPGGVDARIAGALETLRTGEQEALDEAVRTLALAGPRALPAVRARYPSAPARERLLLLAAMRRVPEAADLLEHARGDPSPAIRAWLAVPPRDDPPLRVLARRYRELVALVEKEQSRVLHRDLRPYGEAWREPPSWVALRDRLRDQRFAAEVRWRRAVAAHAFARRGARALREGALACDPDDPVFVTYLGLLDEEKSGAFYFALTALVEQGEALAPILERRLDEPHREPEKLLRLLVAVRADRARPLFDALEARPPDVQRAMVDLVPELFDREGEIAWLERAALVRASEVRRAALDALSTHEPPAGVAPARLLFDPATASDTDLPRAALLLARVGEIAVLSEYATIDPPDDGSESAAQLRLARRAARAALRAHPGPAVQAFGRELLGRESTGERLLGLELVSDPGELLAVARTAADPTLAREAATRALETGGPGAGERVVALLAERGLDVPYTALAHLTARRDVEALLAHARHGDPAQAARALHRLALLPSIDPRHEPALLALWNAASAELRPDVLAALVPLGTPAVRAILESRPDDARRVLRARAQGSLPIPFAWPVIDRIADAPADDLEAYGLIVQSLPEVEPGVFHRLLHEWRARSPAAMLDENVDRSPREEQEMLLDALSRSSDADSARRLLDELVTDARPDPSHLFGVLKAAARLLDADALARLEPLVRSHVAGEYADPDGRHPPWDPVRARMLAGGLHALAWKRVPAGLALCCDLVLDPRLQPSAYDWDGASPVAGWALDALRMWPAEEVEPAFRAALERAGEEGALAALHPEWILGLVQHTQEGREHGRALSEVGLALCEVLARLPWEGDTGYETMRALGGLRRYAEAAAAARGAAARKRARDVRPEDDYWWAGRLEGRARLYEALAGGDPASFDRLASGPEPDPLLQHVGAWYLYWYVPDLERAAACAERAVRASAGLYHSYRDLLAAIRTRQGKPREALHWLDPRRRLPIDRPDGNRWHLYFQAEAHLALGDVEEARRALELALLEDRRLLRPARANGAFRPILDVFARVESDYLDRLFSSQFFE